MDFIIPDLGDHFDSVGSIYRSNVNQSQTIEQIFQNNNINIHESQTIDTFIRNEQPSTTLNQNNNSQQQEPPLIRTNSMNLENSNFINTNANLVRNYNTNNSINTVS